MAALRVGVTGLGRAGAIVTGKIIEDRNMSIVLVAVREGDKRIGRDIGKFLKKRKYNVKISGSCSLRENIRKTNPQVIVDFTNPHAFLENIKTFAETGTSVVIGTTGFTKRQESEIKKYGCKIGIVFAPNLTEGVCIMMALARIAAMLLPSADIDIIESHNKLKKDAPSGTARLLLERLKDDNKRAKNTPKQIKVHSIRAGGVISKHEVQLTMPAQVLGMRHDAIFQDVFGSGVLKAIRWVSKRKGAHSMEEVLGLEALMRYAEKISNSIGAGKK